MEPINLLRDKRIVLGVTGGIAVYKVATLASRLTQVGAEVDVVMTEAATRFVAPLTFQALTGRPVYTDLWRMPDAGLPTHISHVGLAHAAHLLVIVPATANTLAKLALGLGDNLLSTLCLAAQCPILVVPAMDMGMWNNAATQANVETLRGRGVRFAGPAWGRMASGLEGEGRMIEPDEILGHIRNAFATSGRLSSMRVLVTAGPTREPIDPVRFITNPSSGRQGFALAQAALDYGAQVTLISGPTHLPTPVGAGRIDVTTAQEMHDAILSAIEAADILLMAAAVGDYRPVQMADQKIKKSAELDLSLVRTPDILSSVAARRAEIGQPRVVVGFAAESEHLVKNARAKLLAKRLDLIVANDITAEGAGFAAETNRVTIIDRHTGVQSLPLMSKSAVADAILERVVNLMMEDDADDR
jgi:phosphopantothenoylcysteine decarboxylase/phosphopantothenate--cysteine ligase